MILEILPDAASLCGVKGYDPAKRGNDLLTSIHKAMVRVRSMGDALYRESFDADSRSFIDHQGIAGLKAGLEVFGIKSRTGAPLTREARRAVSGINSTNGISLTRSLKMLIDIFKGEFGWRASVEMLDSGCSNPSFPSFPRFPSWFLMTDTTSTPPAGIHCLQSINVAIFFVMNFQKVENVFPQLISMPCCSVLSFTISARVSVITANAEQILLMRFSPVRISYAFQGGCDLSGSRAPAPDSFCTVD